MKKRTLAVTTLLLTMCFLEPLVPRSLKPSSVAFAEPDMLPSDGDAWTEIDNSTIQWTSQDRIEFTTDNTPKAGVYSLKVTHTIFSPALDFSLDLKVPQDFSIYDAVSFWLYLQGNRPTSFNLYVIDSDGFRFAYRVSSFDNATWIRVVIPLNAFFAYSHGTTPSWSAVQKISFVENYGTQNGDYVYYVDGLRVTDFETPSFTPIAENESDVMGPNFFYSTLEHGEKRVLYGNAAYTSCRDYVDIESGTPQGFIELESQSLGQTLFAMAIAYNQTKSTYLKTKIETYASWIDKLRSPSQYKGIRNYFINNSLLFDTQARTIANGWILGGLAYMYGITGNATCKNIADDIRIMLVDQVWNDTTRSFESEINVTSGVVKGASHWTNDLQGSAVFGLSAYYRFVSANETVKDRVDKCLTQQLTRSFSSAHDAFTTFNFEQDVYMHWGYYEAYKAFNDGAYWKYALAQAQINLAYNMIYLNGSMGIQNNFVPVSQDEQNGYLDEWGAVSSLLLLLFLHNETGDPNILQSFRLTMFNHIPQVKTSRWLVSRYRNAKSTYEMQYNTKSWIPTQAFIYASLVKYYSQIYKPLRPYPVLSTAEVKDSRFVPFTYSVTRVYAEGTNTTVQIYVPYNNSTIEEPFPNDSWQHYVNDTRRWGSEWNPTNRILTVWVMFNGTFRIFIDRETIPPIFNAVGFSPENPQYSDIVKVQANIIDNSSGVRRAIVSYHEKDAWTNITMGKEGPLYVRGIGPFPFGRIITCKLYATDNAGNWAESGEFSFTVGDATPPAIEFYPLVIKQYSSYYEVTFRLSVTEPIEASGVKNATFFFRVDYGDWHSEELVLQDWVGTATIQVQNGFKIIEYKTEAYDNVGNKATSETYSYVASANGLPIPLIVGIAVVAIAGVTGILLYIFKLRKPKEKTSNDATKNKS